MAEVHCSRASNIYLARESPLSCAVLTHTHSTCFTHLSPLQCMHRKCVARLRILLQPLAMFLDFLVVQTMNPHWNMA